MRPSPRVLVIDDERVDRTIALHAATRAGYRATGAGGVAEARALLEQGPKFDCVVLDLSLGNEDGLAILHTLAHSNQAAVVVFASGFDGRVLASSQRVAAGLGLQVAGVLRKPILPAALCEVLRQAPQAILTGAHASQDIAPHVLRLAIADGQICAWFQPKALLGNGAIIGAEALARWITPEGVGIAPGDFIPVAEQCDLIAPLTDTILDQALRACARWRAWRPDCSVAVNVSPLLLEDPGLTARIEARLQAHGVPGGALVVEITEGRGIPDTVRATETLTRLRIRGVNLAIDDFGTGHASLLSLVRAPFNELKIDQAFVREAATSGDSRKVVWASALLGRELGLKVVAEGVESETTAQIMRDAGCDIGQGWLYGRAMPMEAFEARLAPLPAPPAA